MVVYAWGMTENETTATTAPAYSITEIPNSNTFVIVETATGDTISRPMRQGFAARYARKLSAYITTDPAEHDRFRAAVADPNPMV